MVLAVLAVPVGRFLLSEASAPGGKAPHTNCLDRLLVWLGGPCEEEVPRELGAFKSGRRPFRPDDDDEADGEVAVLDRARGTAAMTGSSFMRRSKDLRRPFPSLPLLLSEEAPLDASFCGTSPPFA